MTKNTRRPRPPRGRARSTKQAGSAEPSKAAAGKTTPVRGQASRAKNGPAQKTSGDLRLHVILSRAGIASRRHAENLIRGGQVTVNGEIVTRLGTRANPESDHIKVRGRLIAKFPAREYFAYHKPVGCVTTLSDPEGRPCVGEAVADLGQRLYPVGRLDFHSSGLLLLTNDGAMCALLTHPQYHVEKRYVAKVSGLPTEPIIARLCAGVDLADGRTAPASVRLVRAVGSKAWMEVRITEGRNRQVRRMLEAVGLRVEKLRRTAVGPIELGSLPVGAVRRLTAGELRALRKAVTRPAVKETAGHARVRVPPTAGARPRA